MSITIELPAEWEDELRQAARRQGKDVLEVVREGIQRLMRPDILPEPEAELLQIINTPLPREARKRRDDLLSLQSTRPLDAAERAELEQAVDAVEIANARRWQAVAQLAAHRGLSLPEIARELEIPLP
jgi:hypothetical protein